MAKVAFICAALTVAGCTADGDVETVNGMTPGASAYLTSALDVMEKHSLVTADVDWPKVRRNAVARAQKAQTPAETYGAIRQALRDLDDRHSTFFDPQEASQALNSPADDLMLPEGRHLAGAIGYLTLPPVPSDRVAAPYVRAARSTVSALDEQGTCGWVIDMRSNSGGDMWGPLAAVGRILGDGTVGAAVYADGEKAPWAIENGTPRQYIDEWGSAPSLARPMPPVAVLTSRRTASAAEAVTIAFRGRSNTRTFGQPTAGVPTANAPYQLSDGALVILTVAREADRNGNLYNGPIAPDVNVPITQGRDQVLTTATDWLRTQDGCHKAPLLLGAEP
ncbi:S41 family peptidase (plasmid) [Streptomyces sp. NBC_00726]|uniref:S41 family peptidase n=1 Tax=Streptomyces sp. NBC_00726 TaxID=2903674 RepID=UPI00386B8693